MYMYTGIEVHVSATEPRTGVDEAVGGGYLPSLGVAWE